MGIVTRIAIIGGGPAGYEAAQVAAGLGAEVSLIESDGAGGACVLYDCVPSKTLIATSERVTALRAAAELGLSATADVHVRLRQVNERVRELAASQSEDIKHRLLAAGVRLLPGYPLERALDGASVVVHHGGAGCTMTALTAGVPQVAVTFAGEQAANGERVTAAGAGRHLPGADFDADAVAGAVADLLRDARARRVAADLRGQCLARPAPADLVPALARLAATAAPADLGVRW